MIIFEKYTIQQLQAHVLVDQLHKVVLLCAPSPFCSHSGVEHLYDLHHFGYHRILQTRTTVDEICQSNFFFTHYMPRKPGSPLPSLLFQVRRLSWPVILKSSKAHFISMSPSQLFISSPAIVICNHQTYFDWWYIWLLAHYYGKGDCLNILLKSSLRYTLDGWLS